MLLGDRCEAARVVAGREFSRQAAGSYRQYRACHLQVGAEVGDGELEGRHGDTA
jgi:hypothetical protein